MWSYFKTPAVHPNMNTSNSGTGDLPSTNSDTSSEEVIDLKGDQLPELKDTNLKLSAWDIWALGLSTTFGGHFYLWSVVSLTGFGGLLVTTFLVFTGYAALMLCIAELASALPFAGGAYGVARVTLGSYVGFLVACFDVYQSMFYAFFVVYILSFYVDIMFESDPDHHPFWWVIIYSTYILAHAWGGRTYWVILKALSFTSLGLLLVYILGCIKIADFDKYAPMPALDNHIESVWFVGGANLFFRALPYPCFFFVGNESLNLAAHDTKNPKVDIPRGYFTSFTTVAVLTFALIFVTSSVSPGTALMPYLAVAPLSTGYMLLFDIDIKKAIALTVVPIYTSGFGFTYYYASQMRAMGKSGLVNTWLGYDMPYLNTPVNALLFGAAIGFLVGCRYQYLDPIKYESLFHINLIGAVCVYFTQFISFIVFRWYYPTIKREFTSPLGIYGAVYGIVLFIPVFVALVALETSIMIMAFVVYVVALTIYYVLVVRHRQMFSEEEKTVLFKAYLMKTNRQKHERIRQGKRQPLTATQSIVASVSSFFQSPAPSEAKYGTSLASDSNSASISHDSRSRPKPGHRAQDYSEQSIRPTGSGERQGSTVRLYGASNSSAVPRVASIGEESPTNERGLELTPQLNTNYAAISTVDAAPTSSNLINDAIVSNTSPNEDLEANIQGAFVTNEVNLENKTDEKGSFRYSVIPASNAECPNYFDGESK